MEMKDKYAIINKTTIQKRIEELEEYLQNEPNPFINTSYQTELDTLQKILSQSTPLIPEIEKAQLNEYTANVIKQALETAAENVKMCDINENCHYQDEEGNFPEFYVIDKQSITNTFEETYNKLKL